MMGSMGSPGTVALVSSDLMFASQISTTMRQAGRSSVLVAGDDIPDVDLVFVDLNGAVDARIALITRLRHDRPDAEIVGFCHHADRDLRRRARAAGATRVINNGALQAVALRLSRVRAGDSH
jgi:DNA-binding NarL/FixJ family response regulator